MFNWVHGKKNKKGFTLLELIVVMGVLGILVAMGVPKFLGYTKDANVAAMKADVKILEQAGLQYALENSDEFPVDGEAIEVTTGSGLETYLNGNEIKAIDEEAIADFVRSTANDISKYAMVTTDSNEGVVVYVGNEQAGVVNASGGLEFGINKNNLPEPAGD